MNIACAHTLERGEQAAVDEMQPGRLDQAFQVAAMPGRHAPNQKHLLQQGQPAFDRLVIHAESAGQGGQIERLASGDGGVLEQPGQFGGFRDRGDLDHIARRERAGIGREPGPAARAESRR